MWMREPREPASLAIIRKEVEELLFLIERLDRGTVSNEESIRNELAVKLTQARQLLADLIIQRTL
jgi:hypothetical protein